MKGLILIITCCIAGVGYIDKETHEIETQAKLIKDYSFDIPKETMEYEREKFYKQMKYFDSLIFKK